MWEHRPAAGEDLGDSCRRSWCRHRSILHYSDKKDEIISGKRCVLEIWCHDRTEEEDMKKKIGTLRRRDGAGDKELSGRTED